MEPLISSPKPILTRLSLAVRLWAVKIFVAIALMLLRTVRSTQYRAVAPTYTKRYPIRPMLKSRIYLPKSYTPGTKLPLYINIHGGGWAICDPAVDDMFCRHFADDFGYCIVSLDYRKAPSYPFPVPVHDCAELARAVLADKDLPIDHEKIVIGGFSAGGNLSLAIAQFEDLRDKFKALVPFYPVTDLSRTYRGGFKKTVDGKEDVLKHTSDLFNWAYVPPGTDLRNPLLSTVYATRTQLPQKMYFVGAEHDCLVEEAYELARRLADVDIKSSHMGSWYQNGIRWELVPGQRHGFTQMEADGQDETKRRELCSDLYKRIDTWIKQEVFQN